MQEAPEMFLPRAKLTHVQTGSVKELVWTARNTFSSGRTRPVNFRERQLKLLKRMYEENNEAMAEALTRDLGKPRFECYASEINVLKKDLEDIIGNFKDWLKPEKRRTKLIFWFDKAFIYNDPYGVILIIGHWNNPIHSMLQTLPAAIAAGNCVILKPSKLASATSNFLSETIPKYLDRECYQVYEGDDFGTRELLKERFDYVSFLGEAYEGMIIYNETAKFITPTHLILQSKNPIYLDDSVNMDLAVRRILWGKCLNAGQTITAPEYLLCTREVQEKFIKTAAKVLDDFYENNPKSSDLCRIISEENFYAIIHFIKAHKIALGGKFDINERCVEPTILVDVKMNSRIMEEQIHGPVLPIVNIRGIREAITYINARGKPLALYIFSNKKCDVDRLINSTSCGGITVNDVMLHDTFNCLPFGGVGSSGMGCRNGKRTFDSYVHKKSVLKRPFWIILDKIEFLRYPPYSSWKRPLSMFLLKKRKDLPWNLFAYFLVFLLGVVCSLLVLYLTVE